MTDTVIPDLTIAALEKLDQAATPTPFIFGIASTRVTFPDVLGMSMEDNERFLADMESSQAPAQVLRRWLSKEDYQLLVDNGMTARQAALLIKQATTHYQGSLGTSGEGESSGTA